MNELLVSFPYSSNARLDRSSVVSTQVSRTIQQVQLDGSGLSSERSIHHSSTILALDGTLSNQPSRISYEIPHAGQEE